MRILLIEDDLSTAESIERILRKADLNTYVTDSGEEGIELAKLYDYDLILLDLSLPDINGYDVLRKLRMSRIDTPILILTGLDGAESKVRGFGAGADDYLMWFQPIAATHSANFSAGVWYCKVLRGRSLSWRAMALSFAWE